MIEMHSLKCEELILTTLATRGRGRETDPVRCITQVYSKEGYLLAEHDPALKEMLHDFAARLDAQQRDDLYDIIGQMH